MISARNQIKGRISEIQGGEVMSLVTMQTGDLSIISSVTNRSVKELGLKVGDSVTALIKSTEAMVLKGERLQVKISARNRFAGQVSAIDKGQAMGFVAITSKGLHLGAAITRQAVDDMQLAVGDPVIVAIKATEVMVVKD